LLSSKYAPIQRVSPAQLTNIALAAVSTLFPDAMWDKVGSEQARAPQVRRSTL
jgi:hypothetical protein